MLVGLYPRVSTQEQAENGYSIDEQIDRMTKYCEAMGWQIYKVYTDAGFSGASLKRPALQQLIQDVKSKRIEKVLVYKLDRLSRSQKDTLYLIEEVFLKNDVDFVSMSEQLDTKTPLGKAMIGLLSVFAQLEREQIKERMMMGKLQKAKRGYYHGSFESPIGYDYTNKELTVNDFEAMQIRLLFELFLEGKSPSEVANILNDKGYYHRHGKWSRRSVRHAVENRLYIGKIQYQKKWYDGVHEPIIDMETYEKAQRVLEKRRDDYHVRKNTGKPNSLFGGLIVCGYCGARYNKETNRKKHGDKVYEYVSYKCASRSKKNKCSIRDPNCNNKIWSMTEFDSLMIQELKKLKVEPAAYTPQAKDNSAALSEIEKIEKQLEKLIDLYTVGNIPRDVLQNKIEALAEQKDKLELSIAPKEDSRITKKEAVEVVNSLNPLLESGNIQEIRVALCELIDYIEVNGEDITVYWNIA